jgi:hypothetical protein
MDRLAVYGWTDATAPLLEALCEHPQLKAVAIGDERPAALVRARAATARPVPARARNGAQRRFDVILVARGAGRSRGDCGGAAQASCSERTRIRARRLNAARRYGSFPRGGVAAVSWYQLEHWSARHDLLCRGTSCGRLRVLRTWSR